MNWSGKTTNALIYEYELFGPIVSSVKVIIILGLKHQNARTCYKLMLRKVISFHMSKVTRALHVKRILLEVLACHILYLSLQVFSQLLHYTYLNPKLKNRL
jgi:hypothetical protein